MTELETAIKGIGTTKTTSKMILVEYMCPMEIEIEQVMEQETPEFKTC